MPGEPKLRTTRLRLRFSMRSLLIAVTILCMVLAWRLHRAKQQREAVKAIRDAGGWVYYDYHHFDPETGSFAVQAEPWEPVWLRDLVGVDFSHDVTAVNMAFHEELGQRWDNKQSPRDIGAQLAHLPRLRFLGLSEHSVDDAGMYYVGGLKELEVLLYWDAPGITDVGAAHLRDMPRLRHLGMGSSDIGDSGLKSLFALSGLEGLVLQQGNTITDEGLASLTRYPPRLKSLWIGGDSKRPSKITDAGVSHLAKLLTLEELDLQRSQVTMSGLQPLQALPNLKRLYLSGSQADDMDAVSAMFPKCTVTANKKR